MIETHTDRHGNSLEIERDTNGRIVRHTATPAAGWIAVAWSDETGIYPTDAESLVMDGQGMNYMDARQRFAHRLARISVPEYQIDGKAYGDREVSQEYLRSMKPITAAEIYLGPTDEIYYRTNQTCYWQGVDYLECVTIRKHPRGVEATIVYPPGGGTGPLANSRVFKSLRACLEWIGCADAPVSAIHRADGAIAYDLGTIDFRF